MFETEVKASLASADRARERLRTLGAEFHQEHQSDVIYARSRDAIVNPSRGTVVLRLRRTRGLVLFTAKEHRSSELDCIEHEVTVDNFDAMAGFLHMIDFREVIRVTKLRESTTLDDIRLCIDTVDGLGAYIEAEQLSDKAPSEHALEHLRAFVESLDVGHLAFVERGYDRLLLEGESA